MSTIDERIPADQLRALLDATGLTVTWPPGSKAAWRDIARRIARGEPLPPRPTVYAPAVIRAIHTVDAATARAVMRSAGGWLQAPHGDDDFEATLRVWETGECGDGGDGGQHWVAASATFGRGLDRVELAHCKDCGLPVYTIPTQAAGWRPIWLVGECR